MEGVQVVKDGDLIAVLHKDPDAAGKALDAIKAQFDVPKAEVDDETIFDHLVKGAGEPNVVAQGGDIAEGQKLAEVTVEATYLNSYVAHAPMEPHSAVAQIEGGKATVWASTQTPFPLQGQVAQAIGLPAENVRVIAAVPGRRIRGKEPRPAGHRGGPAGEAGREARPGRLDPRGGVLLRHVQAGGRRQDQVGDGQVRRDRVLGLRRLLRRRARRAAVLQHPAPSHGVLFEVERRGQRPSVRHRPLARAGQQHQHLCPGVAD